MSKCNVGYSLKLIYIHILSYYKLVLYFTLCLSVMLDSPSHLHSSVLTTSCSFTMLCVYVYVSGSYYKLFIYYTFCLSVVFTLSCSFTFISFLTTSCSFTLCLYFVSSVMLDTLSCSYTSHSYPFLLQAVPLLYFVSKCNVGYSIMFIYIHIVSYSAVPLLYFVSKCNVGYSIMFIYPFLLQAVPLLYFVSKCNVR